MNIEHLILKNLIHNEQYSRNILPFLDQDYFFDSDLKTIFNQIKTFITQYNERPSIEAVKILISESSSPQPTKEKLYGIIDTFKEYEKPNLEWITNETEKFCKDKSLELSIIESLQIINGTNKTMDRGAIPDILKNALSVSFDPSVGHDFFNDAPERFDFYHKKEERIPFDIQLLNLITNGGLPKKTLTVILGGTNVGKSLVMCHFATSFLQQNKNVLYITLEMAEERIAERIDANLLDISLDTLKQLNKEMYMKLINKHKEKHLGNLIIKEYPTAGANVTHFKRLLNELALKKKFVPDVIFVDYLNICSSSRIKGNATGLANSYVLVKSIAEELRGLAVESNTPIITGTQMNRTGYTSSDPDLTTVSESFGTSSTADLILALMNNEEMEQLGQIMIKQLKNRFNDVTQNKRFFVGIDRSKMRIYDIENSSESGSSRLLEEVTDEKFNKFEKFKF